MRNSTFAVSLDDVCAAEKRSRPFIERTPLRSYPALDAAVGHGIRVLVKHENHLPTNAFKIRNGLSAMTALSSHMRKRGVVSGSTGNHGQGVAYAGMKLGISVTVVVPNGNNPDKNAAVTALGARLIEYGTTYDDAAAESERISRDEGLTLVHSTNNRDVIAGAGTITLEVLEQTDDLDAMVIAVGGGSQAVGALAVLSELRPTVRVFAVGASGAPAVYESWKAGAPSPPIPPKTLAEGIATAKSYEMTLRSLCDGLDGFVTVSDDEIIDATRLMISSTHNLAEPAGAAGLAGLFKLRRELEGRSVCVILSGSNLDADTLRRVVGSGRA
jgi:threonine dehydratase